jgi:hypothetical protein
MATTDKEPPPRTAQTRQHDPFFIVGMGRICDQASALIAEDRTRFFNGNAMHPGTGCGLAFDPFETKRVHGENVTTM